MFNIYLKYKQLASALAAVGFGLSCQSHKLGMETKEGIDISHCQYDINWEQLTPERSGKTFCISKATEGKSFQDSKFVQNWRSASDAGFQVGAYHVLRFGTSSPDDQMENLLTQIRKADNDWTNKNIIALSIIDPINGEDRSLISNVVESCVQTLQEDKKVFPYIYVRKDLWDPYMQEIPEIVKECPLWFPKWSNEELSPGELPNGWSEWKIWNYSNKGRIPGITKNTVCLDKMKTSS